jgi:hypothetical protein
MDKYKLINNIFKKTYSQNKHIDDCTKEDFVSISELTKSLDSIEDLIDKNLINDSQEYQDLYGNINQAGILISFYNSYKPKDIDFIKLTEDTKLFDKKFLSFDDYIMFLDSMNEFYKRTLVDSYYFCHSVRREQFSENTVLEDLYNKKNLTLSNLYNNIGSSNSYILKLMDIVASD